jgi:hypothetical protein
VDELRPGDRTAGVGKAMSHDGTALDAEVGRLLKTAETPSHPCPLTACEFRERVLEYLADYDSELVRWPELSSVMHWNLWLWDAPGSPERDAFFAVVDIRRDGVELAVARGRQQSIREFADSDFPDDAEQVLPQLSRLCPLHFSTIRIDRDRAVLWLGRDIGLRTDR